MIRPMALLGMIVIAIAVFSYLLIPSWRSSAAGIGALILCLGIGAYAVVKDMQNFMREMDAKEKAKKEAGSLQSPEEKDER